jgi:hypothetical protein
VSEVREREREREEYVGKSLNLVSEWKHVSVANSSELFHFAPFCVIYVKHFCLSTQNSYVFVVFKEQVDSAMHFVPPTYEL